MERRENADLETLSDEALRLVIADLERRQPGSPATGARAGLRPRRQPWSYRDGRRLEAARAEAARRQIRASGPPEEGQHLT